MDKIAAAFVKAQAAFGPALKSSTNPHFKSRYADLAACIEAVIDALNSHGIALIQKSAPYDGGVSVETVFVHASGETLSAGVLQVPAPKQDPQGYGSAMTYARRYSLMAACGIAPEDDDGNAGSRQQAKTVPAKGATPAKGAMPADLRDGWIDYIKHGEGDPAARLADALSAAEEVRDAAAAALFKRAAE